MNSKNHGEFNNVHEIFDKLASDMKLRNEEGGTEYSFINPNRIKHITTAYSELRNIICGKGVKVDYDLCGLLPNFGCISIVGHDIQIKDTDTFSRIARSASNFEILPKTDGVIEMNFGYYGLTDPIE